MYGIFVCSFCCFVFGISLRSSGSLQHRLDSHLFSYLTSLSALLNLMPKMYDLMCLNLYTWKTFAIIKRPSYWFRAVAQC